jgi:hypothetical protein
MLKCGYRDNACTQSYWQIQSFKRWSYCRARHSLRRRVCKGGGDGGADTVVQAVGEQKRVKKKKASGKVPGTFMFHLWRHGEKGGPRHKKPPPGHKLPEGASADAPPGHSPTRRAYQRGGVSIAELLLQGLLLHEYSCPTPWIFAPTNFNRVPLSSARQAAHASPVSHDRDSPARPAGRRCPVGARRLSICVRVAREAVPGDTSGPRPPCLTLVSSHGPREHTADAVNPG